MTHEKLIDEGERWLRVMEDGEDLTQWVYEAVEALMQCKCSVVSEDATTNSELTVEWSICYASGQVIDRAMGEQKARAMAGQGGTRLIKRTVGPWEVVE